VEDGNSVNSKFAVWQFGILQAQLSLGKANCTTYVRSPAAKLQSQRESELSEMREFHACYVNAVTKVTER